MGRGNTVNLHWQCGGHGFEPHRVHHSFTLYSKGNGDTTSPVRALKTRNVSQTCHNFLKKLLIYLYNRDQANRPTGRSLRVSLSTVGSGRR